MCKGTEVFKPVPLCIPRGVPLQKLPLLENVKSLMSWGIHKIKHQPGIMHSLFQVSYIFSLIMHKLLAHPSLLHLVSLPQNHSQNLRECELCSQSVWSNIVHLYLEKSKVANLFIYPGTRELQEQRGLWFLRDNSILILYITKELVNQYRNFNKTC